MLRIHRPGHHSYETIYSELAWLTALQADCIEVTQPVAVQNGELIQPTTHSDLQSHWVVLFN